MPEHEKAMQDHGSAAQTDVELEKLAPLDTHEETHASLVNSKHSCMQDSQGDEHVSNIGNVLVGRTKQEPFSAAAGLLFLPAINHTF